MKAKVLGWAHKQGEYNGFKYDNFVLHAQIVAIYDRQAPNYGVSAEIDPDTKKITAEVVSLNMM